MNDQLPLNWEYRRLADVADVVSGGTPSRDVEAFWQPSEIEWVTPTDITREKTRTLKEAKEKISQKGLSNSSAKLLPINTVLMTSRATLGEMKVSASECCTNQGFKSLIPRAKTDVWFLYYQMMRKKPEYEALGIGSTFLEVNKKDTDSFLIEFPPYDQQQKIAKILTTVDNLIEKTQALIDKYAAIKQGMMADLFTRGIDLNGTPDTNPCHGQLRPPVEQSPELYKQTELGWVPTEWEVYTFDELADYKNGSSFSADDWKEEGLPIIRIQNLNGSNEYNYYQGEVKESWHVLPGDLLFAWSGQKGVSFGARLWGGPEGVLNQHIFKVYENRELLSRKFLYYLFKINVGRIEDNAHGFKDSFVHVTRSELTDVAIMLPPFGEQKIIEDRVLALDNSLSIEEGSLKKYGKLKKGLMQDLLTGKEQVNE
jgi:type I restriction enzyme S subunit